MDGPVRPEDSAEAVHFHHEVTECEVIRLRAQDVPSVSHRHEQQHKQTHAVRKSLRHGEDCANSCFHGRRRTNQRAASVLQSLRLSACGKKAVFKKLWEG